MNKSAQITFVLALALFLASCVRHSVHPVGVNYFVGPECAPQAKLKNCDLSDPPRCEKIALNWKKGCEQLQVKP